MNKKNKNTKRSIYIFYQLQKDPFNQSLCYNTNFSVASGEFSHLHKFYIFDHLYRIF